MSLNLFLLLLAMICALVITAVGFEVIEPKDDPHLAGWLGLALLCYFAREVGG